MLITDDRILKRILLLSLAGTRGGPVRLEIISLIKNKPHNMNELSNNLSLDYKTVQHHIRFLEKAGILISGEKKYANAYDLSPILKSKKNVLDEVITDLGKTN